MDNEVDVSPLSLESSQFRGHSDKCVNQYITTKWGSLRKVTSEEPELLRLVEGRPFWGRKHLKILHKKNIKYFIDFMLCIKMIMSLKQLLQ